MPDDQQQAKDPASGAPASASGAEREAGGNGEAPRPRVPIVGVGASAGGLRAFTEFFAHLPDQPDLAFVLVQHLAPDHDSELAELLQNHTRMKVMQVEDSPEVRPNCVYVIPPGKNLELKGGRLALSEPTERRGHRAPIDHFFRALAQDQGEHAVCIVLSGTGSDGAQGLRAVKEANGITMAQDPADADYDGMPRAAVQTGLVDVQGTPAELADRLMSLRELGVRVRLPEQAEALPEDDHEALDRVFMRLRERTGHDFSHYKRSTILRRLGRRMQIHHHERITDYLASLEEHPDELDHLFRDFIISVTQFFRDADAFAALEAEVIPRLFEGKGADDQVRVWIPGCATGEEAYSIAMLLCEHASMLDAPPQLQVFATDIDDHALATAREGLYPTSIGADVSPERLRRFFREENNGYRVQAELREVILFAPHNLVKDPPFSRIDLVSCRNLLIYLKRDVQQGVFELFHYALRPGGTLMLGSSESAEGSAFFDTLSKPHHLYARRDAVPPRRVFPLLPLPGPRGHRTTTATALDRSNTPVERLYADWTLQQHAPPRLLVDDGFEIRYTFGGAGDYLQEPEGPATQHALDRVAPALRMDLRAALYHVLHGGEATQTRPVPVPRPDDAPHFVRMHVGRVELPGFPSDFIEVVFHTAEDHPLGAVLDELDEGSEDTIIGRLEDELGLTRERLQSIIEQHETSNEELKASNEELQSMNEELQSTTEELETSREELQSMNEELQTVNQELRNKIEELSRSNSDLQNLMASTEIGTVFLDRDLCVQRYTPRTTDLFNLIPSDIGRPFEHVSHKIAHDHLPQVAAEVLERLSTESEEVCSVDGEWFLMRASPYRTVEDHIDGVVLTFVDITPLKQAQHESATRAQQQAAIATIGQRALEGGDLDAFLQATTRLVADTLEADYTKVLEYRREHSDFLLRAGVGWHEGLVGTAAVPDERSSQAGYTLLLREPIVVADVEEEERFAPPALLIDHEVRSGISVVIRTPGSAEPFGVLGVHDRRAGHFTEADAGFVEAVANVLAEAVQRHEADRRQREQTRTIQEQLREIESIYDTAPVGLAFHDRDLHFVRVNARLAEINGRPVEEHLGRKAPDLLPELNGTLLPIFEHVLETGEPVLDREIRGTTPRDPDTERVWIASYVPVKESSGAVRGINVVVQEVTERVRTGEALQEATARLREAQRIAGLGFWNFDPATGTTVWSDEMYQIFGHDPAAGLPANETIWAQFAPDQREALQTLYAEAARTGESYEGEWQIRLPGTPDGTWRWIRTRTRTARVDDADGYRVFGTVLDITDQKEAAEALRRSNVRLEEVNEALARLNDELEARVRQRTAQAQRLATELTLAEQRERRRIAQILHDDLQQYLYGILIKLNLFHRELGATGVAAEQLRQLEKLVERGIHTTRTLSVDLSPPVLASEGVEQSVQWLALQMEELHGLRVGVHTEGPFRVDTPDIRMLLFQLVRELLFNVVKHAGVEEATVTLTQTADEHRIIVADEGRGFDVAAQLREPGRGFGLYSVRERLNLFGGRLDVDTKPGGGTRLTIAMPRGAEQPEEGQGRQF